MASTTIYADTDWYKLFRNNNHVGGSFSSAWDAARDTADEFYEENSIWVGLEAGYHEWFGYWAYLERSILKFDLSALEGAVISDVDFYIRKDGQDPNQTTSNNRIDIVIPEISSTWEASPATYKENIYDAILSGEYQNDMSMSYGTSWTKSLTASDLNPGGDTFIGLLLNLDRDDNPPSYDPSYVSRYYFYEPGSSYKPYLDITYEFPSSGDLMFWFT